jgi:hypothetical protein
VNSPPASIFSGRVLGRTERAVLAIVIGLACGVGVWIMIQRGPWLVAKDFTYPWRAARALLAGQDPYVVIQPIGGYPFENRFPYPLSAAVAVLPIAWLNAATSAALFFGLSTAALTWGMLAEGGLWRLWLLASAPFAMTLALVQWGPLLMAGALLPALGWALVCKPTVGFALFGSRPSWSAAAGCAALIAISLLFLPGWPLEWLRTVTHVEGHPALVTRPFGWIPLLALLRWRDPDARLVALMAVVPQNPYLYDQLPLWLVARTGRSALALAALSWIAFAGTLLTCADGGFCGPEAEPWVIWLLYVPATLLVFLRGARRAADAAAPDSPRARRLALWTS